MEAVHKHPAERARRITAAACVSAFVATASWFGLTGAATSTNTTNSTATTTQDQNANPFLQSGQSGTVSNQPNTRSAGS